jgi:glyoxylase-like metal-dependent hydrolase (beta-lactamase superfamily II)
MNTSKLSKLLKPLADSTFVMKGSPVTIIYKDGNTSYIIDPGHGSKRAKQLRKALIDLNVNEKIVIITHYHSDHLGITQKINPDKILSSKQDELFIRDPQLRILVTFGYPIPPGSPSLPFDAPGVEVNEAFQPGSPIGPLETVHLPGHTPGQIGIFTPDNVLYLADAAFGEKVLENYYIPYHLDYPRALSTLYKIRDEIARDAEMIVFGHGPLVSKQEALSIIDKNISHHEEIRSKITEAAPSHSVEETVIKILKEAGKEPTIQLVLLATGSVKSIVAREYGLKVGEDKVIATLES